MLEEFAVPATPSVADLSADFNVIGVPAFRDNYIWLLVAKGQAIVVDPGDATPVVQALKKQGLRLQAIWLTHHHADHVGGVAGLLEMAPGTPVFGPAAESITGVDRPLRGGEKLKAHGAEFTALALPGHTRGHLGYFGAGRLFCGDVLFGLGCGRLFEGTAGQMFDSLATIAALPPTTEVFCAHEYIELNLPFALRVDAGNFRLQQRAAQIEVERAAGRPTVPMSLAEELATNPFLRCHVAAIGEVARQQDDRVSPADPAAVFTFLRAWRNQF